MSTISAMSGASRLSMRPLTYRLRHVLARGGQTLEQVAVESWEIAPSEYRNVPPVFILPGQAERIIRTEFAPLDLVLHSLKGNPREEAGPTMAYRLRDIDIIDGVLYSSGLSMHLRSRQRPPFPARLRDGGKGSLYETWVGNRWFGNWLLDDCLSYRLAELTGDPVTTMPERGGHVPDYEALLSMTPQRVRDVHFDELIVFDDHPNNSHRLARAQDMRRRLLAGRNPKPCPGIFLLRGASGDARIMENEDEIAGRLEAEYGFRALFAEDYSVAELMEICGEARIIAGVEGSQLNHGIAVMPPGGCLFTIQPADRVTTAMKLLSDRWQQRFAMVVAEGNASAFRVNWDDIARTMDLIMSADSSRHPPAEG